jgi:hypothetical protein
MINNRNKDAIFSADILKTHIDGVETDVKKVLVLEADSITENEVFPNPCKKIRIRTNYDFSSNSTYEHGDAYGIPKINVGLPTYFRPTISVTVEPSNAAWKLISSTGVDLGVHADVIYYGNNSITLDIPQLAEYGVEVHDVIVIPAYGDLAKGQIFRWEQTASDTSNAADPTVELLSWNFNNSLTSTNGQVTFSNPNIDHPLVTKEVDYSEEGLVFKFNEEVDNFNDDLADPEKQTDPAYGNVPIEPLLLAADVSSVIPTDYWKNGMTVTANVRMGTNTGGVFGLLSSIMPNTFNSSNNLGCQFSYFLPDLIGGPGSNIANTLITSTSYRTPNHTPLYIVATIEPLMDIHSIPELTFVDGTDPETGKEITTWTYEDLETGAYKSYSVDKQNQNNGGGLLADDANLPEDQKVWMATRYYIYQNGGLLGMSFSLLPRSVYTETYDILGDGNLYINVSNTNALIANPVYFDNMTIASGYMSPDEIAQKVGSQNVVAWSPTVQTYEPTSAGTAIKKDWADLEHAGPSEVPLDSYMKPFLIDNRTVALSFAFTDFYEDRLYTEFPESLKSMSDYANMEQTETGRLALAFGLRYCMWQLKDEYEPLIIDKLDQSDTYLQMTDSSASPVTFNAYGWNKYVLSARNLSYQPTAEELVDNPEAQGFSVEVPDLDMAYTVYIKLDQPLVNGETYQFSWQGNTTSLTYDKNLPSRAIKVNQGGYLGDGVTTSRAYIGSWLGYDVLNGDWENRAYNPHSNPDFTNEFQIRRADTDAIVYTGTVSDEDNIPDQIDDAYSRSSINGGYENTQKITGERVYTLDFTDFTADSVTDGEFYIYVPGIGYSWPVKFGNITAAWSYYTFTRGLMYQHCGDPNIKAPYTTFELPNVKSESFYSTGYPTNWRTLRGAEEFKTVNGAYANASDFQLVASAKTTERAREVTGGYMDAADFDRRPMHLRTPRALADSYLGHIDHTIFKDGELNQANAGNGIPDVLDEAIWGIEVFRQAQLEDGSVACWIESDRHETLEGDHDSNIQYKIGAPNRYDSLCYAQTTARVAKALLKADTPESRRVAAVYTESARRAADFGFNPDNNASYPMVIDGVTYYYNESQEYIDSCLFAVATAMYSLTKDATYLAYINDQTFDDYAQPHFERNKESRFMNWGDSYRDLTVGYVAIELKDELPKYAELVKEYILHWAEFTVGLVENHKYDNVHWTPNPNHLANPGNDKLKIPDSYLPGGQYTWSNFTQFGGGHVDTKGYWFVEAYRITRDQKWKNLMHRILGYNNGANPLGMTMTTGIGYTNPTYFLNGFNQNFKYKGHTEPLPGMSPYEWGSWNETIYGIENNNGSFSIGGWGVYTSGYTFIGITTAPAIARAYIPGRWAGNMPSHPYQAFLAYRGVAVRYRTAASRMSAFNVPAGEYTVWETMTFKVPLAMDLMTEAWETPANWSTYVSPSDKWDVDGNLYLG